MEQGSTFGKIFDMDVLGLNLPPDAVIPGVAVASARATPLAGEQWHCCCHGHLCFF